MPGVGREPGSLVDLDFAVEIVDGRQDRRAHRERRSMGAPLWAFVLFLPSAERRFAQRPGVVIMARTSIIGLGAVLLIVIGFAAGRYRSATPPAAGDPTANRAAAALRKLGDALPVVAPPPPAPPVVAANGAPADTAPPEPEPEPTPSATPSEPPPSSLRDMLGRVFEKESIDPKWSHVAERTAETRLRSTMPKGGSLQSVECRSSMCRIQSVHESVDEFQEFVQSAFMKIDTQVWNGGSFSTPIEDGERRFPVTIVTFIAREGLALPRTM